MAKNVYFGSTKKEVVDTINYGLDLIFVKAMEVTRLSADRTKLRKKQADLNSDSTEYKEIESECKVIKDKISAVKTYINDRFYGKDNAYVGIVEKLGFGEGFYNAYVNMAGCGKPEEFRKYIADNLNETFGMNVNTKVVKGLADHLSMSVGIKLSTDTKVKSGTLTDTNKDKKVEETAFRAFAVYVSKTNGDISIPNMTKWSVQVDYDQNLKVTGYKLIDNMEESETEGGEE